MPVFSKLMLIAVGAGVANALPIIVPDGQENRVVDLDSPAGFAPTTVESKLPGHLVCDDSDVVPDEKVHDFIDQCKLSIPNGTVGLHLPLCPGPDGSKILPCTNCTGIWGNADPTTGTVWVEGCCAWPAPIICPGDLSPITDPNEITKFVQTMFPSLV